MNNESPQSNDPGRRSKPMPKMIWLLLVLAPCVLIMLLGGSRPGHGERFGLYNFVTLGLNPAVTCIGCYGLLYRPDRTKVIPIVGGIFLGALFAIFNMMVGLLGGCVLGGSNFR
jgi:hypothetical protein